MIKDKNKRKKPKHMAFRIGQKVVVYNTGKTYDIYFKCFKYNNAEYLLQDYKWKKHKLPELYGKYKIIDKFFHESKHQPNLYVIKDIQSDYIFIIEEEGLESCRKNKNYSFEEKIINIVKNGNFGYRKIHVIKIIKSLINEIKKLDNSIKKYHS